MLRVTLLLLPVVWASTVNFEDFQRLKRAHADCRLKSLTSWNGGQYDLGKLEQEWQQVQNRTTTNTNTNTDTNIDYSILQEIIDQRSTSIRRRAQQILQLIQQQSNYQNLTSTQRQTLLRQTSQYLQNSFFGFMQRSLSSKQVIEFQAGTYQLQQLLQQVRQEEQMLQQQLNSCNLMTNKQDSAQTLQNLEWEMFASRYKQLQAMYTHEHQLFSFTSVFSMWSQFWHEIREYWSNSFFMSESQEWAGWWQVVQTGEYLVAMSEEWEDIIEGFEQQEQTWMSMNCQSRQEYLENRSIMSGMGYFGFLVVETEVHGLNNALGFSFSLMRSNPPPMMTVNVINWSEPHQPRDLFLFIADTMASRDVSSLIHSAIFGQTIIHDGELYVYDTINGHYVHSTGSIVDHFESLTSVDMSAVIDQLLCIYAVRNQDEYARHLRAWYTFGQERGMPEPRKPEIDKQCPRESHSKPVEWKREHLCELRSSNRISESEYEEMTRLISIYEEHVYEKVQEHSELFVPLPPMSDYHVPDLKFDWPVLPPTPRPHHHHRDDLMMIFPQMLDAMNPLPAPNIRYVVPEELEPPPPPVVPAPAIPVIPVPIDPVPIEPPPSPLIEPPPPSPIEPEVPPPSLPLIEPPPSPSPSPSKQRRPKMRRIRKRKPNRITYHENYGV